MAGADERIALLRKEIASGDDLAGVESIDLQSLARAELEAMIQKQRDLVSGHRARILELDAGLSALIQAPAQVAQQQTVTESAAGGQATDDSGAGTKASGSDSATANSQAGNGDKLSSLRRRIAERRQEIARIRLANQETLNALATVERNHERRVLAQREAFLDKAVERLRQLREKETSLALSDAREAQRKTALEPPVIRELADEIVELREEVATVSRRDGAVAEQLQEASTRLDRIRDDFVTTRDRVDVVGATPAVGRMLRRRLANLPSNAGYRRSAKLRRLEISEAIDRQIDIDETLRQFGEVETEVQRLLDPLSHAVTDDERDRLKTRIRELLVEKRDTLVQAHARYGAVAARLTQLDLAQRGLVDKAREIVEYIESELMTIPSQPVFHLVGVDAWLRSIGSLIDIALWRQLALDALAAVRSDPASVVLVLLLAGVLFGSRRFARREIRRIGPLTRKIRTDGMRLTVATLGYSVLLASFLPTILGGAGWILRRASVSDLSVSLGAALLRAAMVLLILGLARQIVRAEGLAIRHFRWTEDTCGRISRNLYWFLPLGTVAITTNWFLFNASVNGWNLFSRLSFLVALAFVVVFFWRVMRQGKTEYDPADAQTALSDPLVRRRGRWFFVLLLVLLLNGGMSYFGYHYTAMRLDFYFGWTAVLVLAMVLLHNLLLRWSTLVQRRLRFNELLKRREESRAARVSQGGESAETADVAAVEEKDLDVVGLGDQTRRVLSAALVFIGLSGLYLIWDDLFPALRVLDDIALPFTHSVIVDGVETAQAVSLRDLGIALIVFAATFIGARNLPGLLEFVVLQRLPIDAGARYATITISRYLIVAVGVLVGFSMIGADWSKLQWLVAALGVGLGFGLQEIVANFISGIILLFERPIRVGDVITLGDTSGTVNKIRIRATTIRNWDQQELVVPNKEFITGRLLNWTLSDPINRTLIPVGVAYGSDVDKALQIMLDVAKQHPHVLDEPEPVVVFEKFGASSLDLVLRCYFFGLEYRITSISEINSEINRRFTEAGIEIPFAQSDVHLNTLEPLQVVVRDGEKHED
ncbi:MAG: potassium transporter [Proteobacteria bacterium]|nr:MAG: potassium transporter [Pseudomonadota bacterium]